MEHANHILYPDFSKINKFCIQTILYDPTKKKDGKKCNVESNSSSQEIDFNQ